ncbi:MAG TPA: cytochrome P450 [Thermoanaerobaculia bacterium]|nr:cytochrome P450 [Thermoanaerobaculia bacterium]
MELQAQPSPALPGPRGLRLLGSLREVRGDRLGFVLKLTRQYGDVVGFRMGWRSAVLVNHPDGVRHVLRVNPQNYRKGLGLAEARPLLGNGLLTSEGPSWAGQRQQLHQVFHAERLESFAQAVVAATLARLERWERGPQPGAELDIGEEMTSLALDVLDRGLLRGAAEREAELVASFDEAQRWAIHRMASPLALPLALPTPASRRARRALAKLDEIVRSLIDAHRREPRRDGEGDALDALLAVAGEPAQEQLRDEMMTLVLAGHETSAATLAWTWYLISQRPAVRERLEAELTSVLEGRVPTFADVPRLEYARMVVQEALRLYPAVWMIPRRAIESDEILGYRVPAGANVLISPYALHRHPGFWDAPDEFLPERFAPGSAYPAGAYLPFGQGPRACVGSAFGMLEAVLVVAIVGARYRLDLAPGFAPVPEALLTLKIRGLRMRLRPA